MARLFIPILLFTAHHGNNDGFAVGIQSAKAFAPPARQRAAYATTTPLRAETDPSDNESLSDTVTANSKRFLLPVTTSLVALSLTSLAAFTGNLPGPPIDATAPPPFLATLPYGVIFSGACEPYSTSLVVRDAAATLFSGTGAALFLKAITHQSKVGNLESRDSRKLIHTLGAPLFMVLWPLFSNAYGARVFASIVPVMNTLRLIVAGTAGGAGSESELAGAISRSGDTKEALGGPFVYVLVFLFATFFFWTDSAVGIVSVATMAVGDGLADLVGRRFGSSNKWSFNQSKSMAGSAAFVVGSFVGSYGLIAWLTSNGAMDPLALGPASLVGRLLAIAVVCAGVELIPVGDDNWTVPLSAAILSALLLN